MKKTSENDILLALNEVDEKYLEAARPKRKKKISLGRIALAASLVIVIGAAIAIGMSGMLSGGGNILGTSGSGSSQTPNNGAAPPENENSQGGSSEGEIDNNLDAKYGAGEDYKRLISIIGNFGESDSAWLERSALMREINEGGEPGGSGDDAENANGSYISISQNQVENVEEPDIAKMTDKYLFRIGGYNNTGEALRIYSVDGENSKLVSEYPIPYFDGSKYSVGAKMFLSSDRNTVTIIKDYIAYAPFDDDVYKNVYKTAVIILDVSDVTAPKEKEHIIFNGRCVFARINNGRLVLGTSFLSSKYDYDWTDPERYLPYYEKGETRTYLSPEDIICPDEIYKRGYINFTLLDDDLDILSTKAVFGLSGITYISEDKIIVSMAYGKKFNDSIDGDMCCKTDVAVLDYSSGSFETEGIITVEGWIEDRFFIDEHDGYLRVVTNKYKYKNMYSFVSESSSLYVYKLSTLLPVASVVDFAPEGEGATSVRFDGDKLYVCTAEVISYIDPVFFFDLSDYSNITQVNTGFIEGFSSTLISFGDGYLLGIGPKDSETNKVSIYKKEGEAVITVAEYCFKGVYATDRKAFLVDADKGLFGFAVSNYRDENGNEVNGTYNLLHFDGKSFIELLKFENSHNITSLRSVYYKGYLYLLKNTSIQIEKVDNFE